MSFEVARSRCADVYARRGRGSTFGQSGRQERRRPSNHGRAKLPSPRRRGLDDGGSGISGTSGPPGTRGGSANQRKRRPTPPNHPSYPPNPDTGAFDRNGTYPPPTFHIRSPYEALGLAPLTPSQARQHRIPGDSNLPNFARHTMGDDHRIWGPPYPKCVARCNQINCVMRINPTGFCRLAGRCGPYAHDLPPMTSTTAVTRHRYRPSPAPPGSTGRGSARGTHHYTPAPRHNHRDRGSPASSRR